MNICETTAEEDFQKNSLLAACRRRRAMAQVSQLSPKVGGHLALFLHSSHEPSELRSALRMMTAP